MAADGQKIVYKGDDSSLECPPATVSDKSGNHNQINNRNLIVNYLPNALSDEELHDIFERIGPLTSAKIMRTLPLPRWKPWKSLSENLETRFIPVVKTLKPAFNFPRFLIFPFGKER